MTMKQDDQTLFDAADTEFLLQTINTVSTTNAHS